MNEPDPAALLRELEDAMTGLVRGVAERRQDDLPGLQEAAEQLLVVPSLGRPSTLGLFVPNCWHLPLSSFHELAVNLLHLNDGVLELANTLVHELAHGYNHAVGLKDLSRQGRWHNRTFAEVAIQLGLHVAKDRRVGHRTTGFTKEAQLRYADLIGRLAEALVLVRDPLRSEARTQRSKQPRRPRAGQVLMSSSSAVV